MAGHAAGDRVDGVSYLHPGFLQFVRHFAQRVLGLGHGHAVTRHDDDLGSVFHDEGRVVRRALLDGAGNAVVRRTRRLAAESAEDDRDEGAVHALAHDVGQDRTGRTHQRAGDDQRGVAEGETDAGSGPTRVRVEHGDHDRHIRTADGDDYQHAQHERDERDQPEICLRLRHDQRIDEEHQRRRERDIYEMARGQSNRGA